MKSKRGITLISLVITIIVLIILVGVTINLTVGENGLITKATRAREEYKKATYFEELNLDILDEQTRKSNNSKLNCQKIHIQKKDLIL